MIESRHPGMSGSRGNAPIAPEVDPEGPQKGRSDPMPRFIGQILRPSSGYYGDSETSPISELRTSSPSKGFINVHPR